MIRGINRNELLTYLDKQGDNILKALNADENTIFRNLHTGHLTSIEKEKLGIFNVQNLSTFFENYEPHRGFNLPLFNRYKQHLEQAQEIVKDNPNESYLEDSAFSDSVFSELRLRYKKVKVKKYIKMVEYKIDLILNEAPESLRKDYYKKVDTEDLFRFFEVAS